MSEKTQQSSPDEEQSSRRTLTMPQKIVIGLALGVTTGLFLGELAAPLKFAGDAFVGLLQMTVLPYIVLALVGGIGKISASQSRLLLGRVVLIVAGLWLVGFLAVLLFGLSLPPQTSASFFSSSLADPPKSFDFFNLFIPSNPFQSLATNAVPAVVMFCLLCGAALIGMPEKDRVIRAIDTLLQMMGRVTGFIVKLSPYGVFCITASAAGTMDLQELGRIQGYLVITTVFSLALSFLLIPTLISSWTPFDRKDLSPLLRSAFILAFATGKTLIVLPMIIEGTREMFKKRGLESSEATSTIEVLTPLAYSFPHLGRILATVFIPFGAWYIGSPLNLDQYPALIGASTFVHFSSSPVSIPFLLDLMRLPNDLYQLFVVTAVYVGRITDAVGAAYILAVTILGTCAATGLLKSGARKIASLSILTLVCAVAIVIGGRVYLQTTSTRTYSKDTVIASMQVYEFDVDMTIVERGPNPLPLDADQSNLSRILERKVIRVGFDGDSLPYTYINAAGELVGFDVEMIASLAQQLGVAVEFVPFETRGLIQQDLLDDYYDLAIGGIVDTIENSQRFRSSDPYMFLTMALVIPDYRDREFSDIAAISELESLRIGVSSRGWFLEQLRRDIPDAELVVIDSPRSFFEQSGDGQEVDALLFSAEAGAAWSMLYPRYQVVTPFPRDIRMPLVYPYSGDSDEYMDEFIDNWVLLSRNDGTFESAYNYWILGEGAEIVEPRWSVVRNVLHWVD
jgi:proton glutamate symport protein